MGGFCFDSWGFFCLQVLFYGLLISNVWVFCERMHGFLKVCAKAAGGRGRSSAAKEPRAPTRAAPGERRPELTCADWTS